MINCTVNYKHTARPNVWTLLVLDKAPGYSVTETMLKHIIVPPHTHTMPLLSPLDKGVTATSKAHYH
jgi:hypothetical protein